MLRGIYSASSGLDTSRDRMTVISNNIANINTVGFKKDVFLTKSFAEILGKGISNEVPVIDKIATDFTPGNLQHTGNINDIAIDGNGFFTISKGDETLYTKRGVFKVNAQGILMAENGYKVMGKNGPVHVGNSEYRVSEKGEVFVGGKKIDELDIVEFKKTNLLEKVGFSFFKNIGQASSPDTSSIIRQEYLEESNVNSIGAVVEMISLMDMTRFAEAQQKTIQMQDDTLRKSVNEVGQI